MSRVVNMLEAKSSLSRLVEAIETGVEKEVIIARNGRPAARIVPLEAAKPVSRRIGLLAGRFKAPEDIDADNAALAALFAGDETP